MADGWIAAAASEIVEEVTFGEHCRPQSKEHIFHIIAKHAEPLVALLRESKLGHCHCNDSWYCCRACRCVDHGLEEGEHLGAGHDDPRGELSPGTCTCAADAWNARVDAALAGVPDASDPRPEDAVGEANGGWARG